MRKFKEYLRSDAAYHILIWSLLVIPHGVFSFKFIERIGVMFFLFNILVMDGLLLAIVYLNVFYLIRKYYKTRQYTLYFLISGILVLVYVSAVAALEMYVSEIMNYNEPLISTAFWHFVNVCRYCVIAFLLFSLREKFEQKQQMDQMKLEKLNTEINYLRAQINPHFLFNTLNNLYALALEKSDQTAEVIIKLSKMMDYMLYELDGSKVPLRKDVENLENYIEIERIRQGNNARIAFVKIGEINDQKIEPLLMLPLVENAFKHGINQMIDGAYLEVVLEATQQQISLSVKNNYKTNPGQKRQAHTSIGIINLKKRLELFYSNKFKLNVYDDSTNYHVNMTLSL